MKAISRLIESIEADAMGNDFDYNWEEVIYSAVDKNFKRFERELKSNKLASDFAEALALSAKGRQWGYFPEQVADTLGDLDTPLLKKVYSTLKNFGFAKSKRELLNKVWQAARVLQDIGDKYFPSNQLMSITNGDNDFIWTECYPEFWRYLLDGLVD